jgi:hypothetical protein
MSYFAKDQVDAAVSGVYGSYGGDAGDVPLYIRPAETERSKEEELAQELYAQRIESEANAITEVGLARAHRDRATLARNSLPIMEYLDRLKKIADAERDVGPISGADAIAIRGSYHDSAEKLKAAQLYNPVMLDIVTRRPTVPEHLAGANPDAVALAGLAAARAVLGLNVEKSARPSQPFSDEYIAGLAEKAVAKHLAAKSR